MSETINMPTIDLVTVEAGAFPMGSNGMILSGREAPEHTVELATYQIGRYPITNAQYLPFIVDTGHPQPDTWRGTYPGHEAHHPVCGIRWPDAWLYCAWLEDKTGQPYHLPTEAQWEKAATWNPRTQTKYKYPWGDADDATPLCASMGETDRFSCS